MFKTLNFKEGFFIYIFLYASILYANPKTPITVSTDIDIEVIKPIEIISRPRIQHNIFKGMTGGVVGGNVSLELKASPNQQLSISYSEENIIAKTTGRGILSIFLEEIASLNSAKGETSAREGGMIKNLVASPDHGYSRIYSIPYEVRIGLAMEGVYEGVVPITISYN